MSLMSCVPCVWLVPYWGTAENLPLYDELYRQIAAAAEPFAVKAPQPPRGSAPPERRSILRIVVHSVCVSLHFHARTRTRTRTRIATATWRGVRTYAARTSLTPTPTPYVGIVVLKENRSRRDFDKSTTGYWCVPHTCAACFDVSSKHVYACMGLVDGVTVLDINQPELAVAAPIHAAYTQPPPAKLRRLCHQCSWSDTLYAPPAFDCQPLFAPLYTLHIMLLLAAQYMWCIPACAFLHQRTFVYTRMCIHAFTS